MTNFREIKGIGTFFAPQATYDTSRSSPPYLKIFWVGLLAMMLLRSFYFGLTYFYFLDDYNTYGVFYRRNADIWNDIILYYPHFSWRPFATFSDAYITQWFWPNMWLVLLFYTLMHFATVVVFKQVMRMSGLAFGLFGIVIVALTPVLAEAVYWIGASTRLVPGMFFSVLGVYFLLKHLAKQDNGDTGRRYLLAYVVTNLLGMGFYEQIMVFNLVFTLVIALVNHQHIYRHRTLILLTPVVNTLVMIAYYIIMAPFGRVGARANMVGLTELPNHVVQTSLRIFRLLVVHNYEISLNGILHGVDIMASLWGAIVLIAVAGFALYVATTPVQQRSFWSNSDQQYLLRLVIGVVLALAPFGPFYILEPQWLPLRVMFASIFGIGMVLDTLLSMVGELPYLKRLEKIVPALCLVPFFVIFVTEVHNYKLLSQSDSVIIHNFLDTFETTGYSSDERVILFNTRLVVVPVSGGGSPHRLENVTSSDWAMQGMANAVSEQFRFTNIQPVRNYFSLPEAWLGESVLLGIDYDLNVHHLSLRGAHLYMHDTGELFGTLTPSLYETEDARLQFLRATTLD